MNTDDSTLIKALTCLSDPTRLNIANHLGRDNPANITRRLFKLGPDDKILEKHYNRILKHLKRMESDQVIMKSKMSENARAQDYELTILGREAMQKKGYGKEGRY